MAITVVVVETYNWAGLLELCGAWIAGAVVGTILFALFLKISISEPPRRRLEVLDVPPPVPSDPHDGTPDDYDG